MLDIFSRTWAVTGELADSAERAYNADGFAGLRAMAELRAASEARVQSAARPRSQGVVQVIPVLGLLTQRGRAVDCQETTSTAALAAFIEASVADPAVRAIVLDMDSPGGEVNGVTEAAEVIRAAKAAKPIIASANGDVGSAAYWLAAQATEIIVTPSGSVGSIGVYAVHVDKSKATEAKGEKVTIISAGKYKVEGNPHEPLAEEAMAHMSSKVQEHYASFVGDVAKGRGVGVDSVRSGFGQGRMVGARAAVESGMADKIGTLDDAIRRAQYLGGRKPADAAARAEISDALRLRS
jgi:capsid assembly protease